MYTNIHIIGASEEDIRGKWDIFEIIAKNFPNMIKETDIQVKESESPK